MNRHSYLFLSLGLALVAGCFYPKHQTSLTPISRSVSTTGAPDHIYEFTFVSANIEPRQRSGHSWDDGGGLPDAFLRVYRNDTLIWESRTVSDTLNPEFNQRPPSNLRLPSSANLRLELWDSDTGSEDPIGIWQGRGLPPTALPGANARILLEGRTWITIRLRSPRAFRGLGLSEYELRSDYVLVHQVEPNSPAGRAELRSMDRITAIDSRPLSDMRPGEATSQISLAGNGPSRLTIVRDGVEEIAELDGGYTWPSL